MQLFKREYKHSDIILSSNGNNLWIGDLSAAQNKSDLKKKNIKTVITCMPDCRIRYDENIRHFFFALKDIKSQNISQYFNRCAKFIKQGLKLGSVLVHCAAGVSRSTTFVIAYLIKQKGMTFHQALKLCKSKRQQVCPNLGFQMQLKFYQKSLKQNKFKPYSLAKQKNMSPHSNTLVHPWQGTFSTKRNFSMISKNTNTLRQTPKIAFRVTMKQFKG